MAIAYSNLGILYQTRSDLDQAEAMCNKALALDEELGRKEGMARDYGNLGILYRNPRRPGSGRGHVPQELGSLPGGRNRAESGIGPGLV